MQNYDWNMICDSRFGAKEKKKVENMKKNSYCIMF